MNPECKIRIVITEEIDRFDSEKTRQSSVIFDGFPGSKSYCGEILTISKRDVDHVKLIFQKVSDSQQLKIIERILSGIMEHYLSQIRVDNIDIVFLDDDPAKGLQKKWDEIYKCCQNREYSVAFNAERRMLAKKQARADFAESQGSTSALIMKGYY